MRHPSNEKWQTTHNGRSRIAKSSSHQNDREKKNKFLGILETDTIKQAKMKEKEEQKITRDKTLLWEHCQRDKYLGCPPRKIFGAILWVDQRRT